MRRSHSKQAVNEVDAERDRATPRRRRDPPIKSCPPFYDPTPFSPVSTNSTACDPPTKLRKEKIQTFHIVKKCLTPPPARARERELY
jgi:hypothetical protein